MKLAAKAVGVLGVAVVLVSACALNATDGNGQAGSGRGELGDRCTCVTEQPECAATGSGCQDGLTCASPSVGQDHSCTRICPCPFGYKCQPSAAGIPRCFR